MKKENDEITDLFRTRLADAGISVRDGFWEELSQEIPVACQHRRRILLFRVAAAASVLLVLAASSATFLYFSPKEEMEEAFTKIAVTNGGQMDGDGIRVNQLPLPVEPVLPKPAPKSYGMLSQYTEEEDSLSITFSMSFLFPPLLLREMATDMVIKGITAFGRQQTVIRNHLLLRKNNRM
jgi:hypothetical protein